VKLVFSENAWEDYLYWQQADRKVLQRINKLLKEIQLEPHAADCRPYPRSCYPPIMFIHSPLACRRTACPTGLARTAVRMISANCPRVAPCLSGVLMSISVGPSRHGRRAPRAVSLRRLHVPQKWPVIGSITPIRP
jgi:hypothetical protein